MNSTLRKAIRLLSSIPLPLVDGMSLYHLLRFFWKAISEGRISTRASSISFSFFLALFPGALFLFTLIPYIPIKGFQTELFSLLESVLPPTSFQVVESTLLDIVLNKDFKLLSFGFAAAVIFATNGTNSLLVNFGQTVYRPETISFWRQYARALLLTFVFTAVFFITIGALLLTRSVTGFLMDQGIMSAGVGRLIRASRNSVLIGSILLSVGGLFYLSPLRNKQWGYFSLGALLSTVLIVLLSQAFGYYVQNFSQYNRLYGSIGTLMILLLWIYLNAFVLIIGFELNTSVSALRNAQKTGEKLEGEEQSPS